MTQPRTFQFYGVAYGNSPVTITASINSTQIFSGTVPTVDLPFPPNEPPAANAQGVLFTIDNSAALNTDFAGSLPMTLNITGGNGIVVQNINCDYYQGNTTTDPSAGTVGNFGASYFGNPTNSENSKDSRSSVVINGVAQPAPSRSPSETGNWPWTVPTDQNISHNWNISVGLIANAYGNTNSYTGDYAAFIKE